MLMCINIDRIELLQRLRREDEERRKREAQEKQRREKLELEMRRKREAGKYLRVTQLTTYVTYPIQHPANREILSIFFNNSRG